MPIRQLREQCKISDKSIASPKSEHAAETANLSCYKVQWNCFERRVLRLLQEHPTIQAVRTGRHCPRRVKAVETWSRSPIVRSPEVKSFTLLASSRNPVTSEDRTFPLRNNFRATGIIIVSCSHLSLQEQHICITYKSDRRSYTEIIYYTIDIIIAFLICLSFIKEGFFNN
jgi:hypothetical protein